MPEHLLTSLKWALEAGPGSILSGLIMTDEELRTALPLVLAPGAPLPQRIPDLSTPRLNSSWIPHAIS